MSTKRITNWAGNQTCLPAAILEPADTAEVAAIVARAHEAKSRVKTVGAGHSFTAAAMTDGTLLRLGRLCELESVDAETGVAVVGAGITLHDLSRQLDAHGRALPNLGDIDVQSVAGAAATATHGTGAALGNIASGIVGLELVTGTGETLWCDPETNAEVWRHARVGIGALGVITRVAIETVPSFNLAAVEGRELLDDLLADWGSFSQSSDHAEFFWLPGTRNCFVKRNNRTTEAAQPRGRATEIYEDLVLANGAFDVAMRVTRRFPGAGKKVSKLIAAAAPNAERIDKSYKIFATPRHVKFMEMEYGIPVAHVPEALDRVRTMIGTLDAPPIFPIEVRVSAADDIPLSTASGRDTGWIAVHQYKGMAYGDYFRAVEAIMDDYDGRPHWGKFHYQNATTLAPRYPEWNSFRQLRAELDPSGTFRNNELDRVLGPIA